jgi:hypothetical protein
MNLWANFKIWLTDKLVGSCCGDCEIYEKCYNGHIEYNEQNTLEHPACGSFK